jgi:hypothetical protein
MRWFLILPRLGARLYWMAALRQKRPIPRDLHLDLPTIWKVQNDGLNFAYFF